MLSDPPVSRQCSNFWQRHHALDAHILNYHTAAISRFPILSIKFFVIFGLFLFTLFNLIFFIPAGWPNFFTVNLRSARLTSLSFFALTMISFGSSLSLSHTHTHTHTHTQTHRHTLSLSRSRSFSISCIISLSRQIPTPREERIQRQKDPRKRRLRNHVCCG